jgi:hypothetical protein
MCSRVTTSPAVHGPHASRGQSASVVHVTGSASLAGGGTLASINEPGGVAGVAAASISDTGGVAASIVGTTGGGAVTGRTG